MGVEDLVKYEQAKLIPVEIFNTRNDKIVPGILSSGNGRIALIVDYENTEGKFNEIIKVLGMELDEVDSDIDVNSGEDYVTYQHKKNANMVIQDVAGVDEEGNVSPYIIFSFRPIPPRWGKILPELSEDEVLVELQSVGLGFKRLQTS